LGRYKTMSKMTTLFIASGFLLVSLQLTAHHGTGISYDESKPINLKGTITEFRFANPHPQLFINVKEGATVTRWSLELAPNPAQLVREGWTKKRSEEALKPGTVIIATTGPSRAGTPVGVVRRIVTDKGEPVVVTGAEDLAAKAPRKGE
jgi:hypothetical protein